MPLTGPAPPASHIGAPNGPYPTFYLEDSVKWAAVNHLVITQRYVSSLNYTNGCGPSSPKERKIASSSSYTHSMIPTCSTKIEDSLADLVSNLSRLRPLNSGVICTSP